jgi:ribosome-binding factor A
MHQGSSRPLKVGETIRHALSEIFLRGECHVPILDSASITVSEVRVSPDLKNATAYVMPLAGSNKEVILEALKINSGLIRTALARKVTLKFTPKIFFKIDESFEEAGKINILLKSALPPANDEE